jgi:intracellular sulfur oxidation DsrE/DsrF family protein
VQALIKKSVRFVAFENTMKKKSLAKDDLVGGSTTVPSGAVEVIRKQSEGYGYFRP